MSVSTAPEFPAPESVGHSGLSRGAPFGNGNIVVSREKPGLAEDSELSHFLAVDSASNSEGVETYPPYGIISYAQNREDILLWRALHDVEDGFYVDVGVQDPSYDSVTRAFYDRGWCGINVEPATCYFEKLCEARPRDVTLPVALGDRVGWATLYECPGTGLSTLVEKVASGHRANGFAYVERRVPIRTLATVWEKFVKEEVHFLKIDVEGFES